MPRSKPQKVVIEFGDGSKSEASFETLPSQLQLELLRQPFASQPSKTPEQEKYVISKTPEQEKYVILEWDDGWREVIQVDAACAEINRYYVISRPEDVGRLSLNKEDGYPELIEIVRKPLDLRRITFLDTFKISLERSDREGKKMDHFFALSKEGDAIQEEMEAFRKAVAEEGYDLQELQSQDPDQLREVYEKIRRKMGIKAAQRQQDVFDFIAYLTKAAD
jgi:hypothetical protein